MKCLSVVKNQWPVFYSLLLVFSCQTKPTVLKTEDPVLTTTKQAEIKNYLDDMDLVFVDVRNPLDVRIKTIRSAIPFWWKDFTEVKKGKRVWVHNTIVSDYFSAKRLTLSKKIVLLYDEKNLDNLKIAECVFNFFDFKTVYKEDISKFRDLPASATENYEINLSGASDWKAFKQDAIPCEMNSL